MGGLGRSGGVLFPCSAFVENLEMGVGTLERGLVDAKLDEISLGIDELVEPRTEGLGARCAHPNPQALDEVLAHDLHVDLCLHEPHVRHTL